MTATDALIAMRAHLITWPGLADIGPRVYNRRAPANSPIPYVVYQRISTVREYNHQGPDGAPTLRVQFVVWDTDPARLSRLGDALVEALEALIGSLGATVEAAFDRDDHVKTPDGKTLDGVQIDAFLRYLED